MIITRKIHWSQRAATFGVSIALIFAIIYVPNTHTPRAHAQLGATFTSEIPASPLMVATLAIAGASSVTAGGTTIQATIMNILNGIAWKIAKVAIQSLTKSIVTWINSGFQGSPAFVTDLNANLLKLSDTYANQFISQLATNSAIKSPFQTAVAQSVQQNYFQSTSGTGFFTQHPFTLDQASPNSAAFLKGDFSQGGFNAFLSAGLNTPNNPIGAQELAKQALALQVTGAQQNRQAELNWGKGFLSWRGSCAIQGSQVQTGASTSGVPTITRNPDGTLNITGGSSGGSSSGGVSLTQTDTCAQYNIQTPGSVIESQLENQLGTGVRQLELADSINEIVGALVQQLVTQVVGGTGLLGSTQPAAGGGSSVLDQATNPNQYTSSTTPGSTQDLATQVSTTIGKVQVYNSEWQKINNAALSAKNACVTSGNQNILTQSVQPVIDKAMPILLQASTTLATLQKINGEIAAAQASGDASQLTLPSAEYLSLINSGTLPDTVAFTTADAESQDTGTTTPGSLYSQMTRIKVDGCKTGT